MFGRLEYAEWNLLNTENAWNSLEIQKCTLCESRLWLFFILTRAIKVPWRYIHPHFVHWLLWSKWYILRRFWPKNVVTMWHYVCCTILSLLWPPSLLPLGRLVTHNTTSNLFDRDCDIMSKILIRKSGSKCHKSPGHPGRCVRSLCTVKKEPWISVPCALT